MKRPYPVPKQFLGAFKLGHRASSKEFIDDDLSYTLLNKILDSNWTDLQAIAELEYITKFNNEYHKDVVKKGDTNALHQEQIVEGEFDCKGNPLTYRKDCHNRGNSRDRDISSKLKDSLVSDAPLVGDYEMEHDTFLNTNRDLYNHEDTLIDLISSKEFQDSKKKKQ